MERLYDSGLTNFGTWTIDYSERLYQYWVYKRSFTPYEEDKKFVNETRFESEYAEEGYIEEVIELPDGDILIGFLDPEFPHDHIEYYKLSEIRLVYDEQAQKDLNDEFDEEEDENDG